MSSKEIAPNPALDTVKWVVVIALLGAGVAANQIYSEQSLLYRVLGLLVVAIVAALIAFQWLN